MVKTRVFELYDGYYSNLTELARAMGISVSQLYRVREGKRRINEKFIVGAVKAFPQRHFSELFYIARDNDPEKTAVASSCDKGLIITSS
jgi:hypothetical protein